MFRKIPFTEKEMDIIGEIPGFMPGMPGTPYRNPPVTPRENMDALFYEKKPFWLPTSMDMMMFGSDLYSKNLSRGMGADMTDVFGIEWEWVPSAGGSIVHPGSPTMDDANNWKEFIRIPDVTQWDWAGEAANKKIDPRFSAQISLVNGVWFERLISFMDFVPAAMALIDDDQKDAVKELFRATTDMACKIVDMLCENNPLLDFIQIHDDWGAQRSPFFSDETAYELFVPFIKQFTDHVHAWGRKATLHSCGHVEDRVECFIDGGFDMWEPQTMNDIKALYEKYGDRIVFGVWPDPFDPAVLTEEEQRAKAREFVDFYSQPGKPVVISFYGVWSMTPAFSDELYRYSRQKYMEIN